MLLQDLTEVTLQSSQNSGRGFALRCALQIHRAVDRRTPEAVALVRWLLVNQRQLGLADVAYEGDFLQGSVPEAVWRDVGIRVESTSRIVDPGSRSFVDDWVDAIAAGIGLDHIEQGILLLTLQYNVSDSVRRLCDGISQSQGFPNFLYFDSAVIGLLVGIDPELVEQRLMRDAPLFVSGVMNADGGQRIIIHRRIVEMVSGRVRKPRNIYDCLVGCPVSPTLSWDDFSHIRDEAELAARVLRAALTAGSGPLHILLYGPPGTGKTSFAATLAAHVGAQLRPVGETDEDDGEPSRDERLATYRMAQRLGDPSRCVLLFDEAEDIFSPRDRWSNGPAVSRVFVHRQLESARVPTIWTANSIRAFGPAVLRRMTLCLELKVPSLQRRMGLWQRMGEAEGVPLSPDDTAYLARLVPTAPALAASAVRTTKLVGGDAGTVRAIVKGVARAVDGGRLKAPEWVAPAEYDPGFVNADADLDALAAKLAKPDATRAVSFLIAGPPGSGKSAWVRYLASRMGMPVLHKRASDLLDAYIGGTEQNIAAAFTEARDNQSFLIFDEADSLLMDRDLIVHRWEVSQVNEMLTWMESHELPFACTTNLLTRLDRASLRRFLVKLRFTWLSQAQSFLAFRRFFAAEPPASLAALSTLTPADFALVKRRVALDGETDPESLVRLLAAECAERTGGRGPIGFAALTA